MSNWKKQHETARQALVTCLNELAGRGVVWITCDSTALVVDTIAWLEQHYLPGEHAVGYFALGDDYPMVTDIEETWSFINEGEPTPIPLLHWKGLGFYTEQVYEEAIPGYYEALEEAAVLPELNLPFTTLLWTSTATRNLIEVGAPQFWEAVTHHFHLESPPLSMEREVQAMRTESLEISHGMLEALAPYQLVLLGPMMEKAEDAKTARNLLEHAAKMLLVTEEFAQALELFKESMRLPLPMTPVKKAENQFNIGLCHRRLDQHEEAIKAIEASLGIFKQVRDEAKQVLCLTILGETCLKAEQYGDAIRYLQQGLDIALEVEDFEEEVMRVLVNLASAHERTGEYRRAIDIYQIYFDEEFHLDNIQNGATMTALKVMVIRSLGETEWARKELADARTWIQTEEGEWLDGGYLILYQEAGIQSDTGNAAAAIALLNDSARLAMAADDRMSLVLIFRSLAKLHAELDDAEEAVLAYLRAVRWSNLAESASHDSMRGLLIELTEQFGEDRVGDLITQHLPAISGKGAPSNEVGR